MMPTVATILALDAVQAGRPRVVAGAGRLDTPVRWVHAIEMADAARLLRGGELVLTTGIALPDDPPSLDAYVAGLARVGVSAVAVELGRRYTGSLPGGFVAAAEKHGLPLVVFEREVPFVAITEAVHAVILEDQLTELRASARLHEVFTDLAVAGAGSGEILQQAALLAGRPVILEDLSHHVLACEPAGTDTARLLDGFEDRSRAAATQPTRTGYDESSGWLVTMVGARGEDWGRLILVCDGRPRGTDMVLVERTATTLALSRLLARQHESLERQAHASLISAILAQAHAHPDEAAVRARALGIPVTGRRLITAVIRFRTSGSGLSAQAQVLEVAEAMADACRGEHIPALVGSIDEGRAGALLSLDHGADTDDVLTAVCAAARQRFRQRFRHLAGAAEEDPVIGVGSAAASMGQVRRSLLEAQQVADAAAQPPSVGGQPFYKLADLRLRGLLHLLAGDARLATFVERELGPLLGYDATRGTDLTGVLAAYLAAGGNKAEAATRAQLARPTLYQRLRHIERILGVSLDSAESRSSLHVALLAAESARRRALAAARDIARRDSMPTSA
jgi:purine catabolism regulator